MQRQLHAEFPQFRSKFAAMGASAITFAVNLDRIRFKATADTFRTWRGVLAAAGRAKAVDAFTDILIICALAPGRRCWLRHNPLRRSPPTGIQGTHSLPRRRIARIKLIAPPHSVGVPDERAR